MPGAIQPHGILLVIDPDSDRIVRAAGDAAALAGFEAPLTDATMQAVLSVSLAELLRQSGIAVRRQPTYIGTVHASGGRGHLTLLARAHQAAIVEALPAGPSASAAATLADIRTVTEHIGGATDVLEACQRAAGEIRRPVFPAYSRWLTLSSPYLRTIALARILRPTAGESRTRAMNLAVGQDPPVIEIRDLHKRYDALEVLRGVDLVAPRGAVVALIGSSGAGKSTLLRCCNLLEDSQQGDILFEGEPVRWTGQGQNRRPADKHQVIRIRTNLAMVFQQFNLWAHMTVLQNVMEAPLTVLRQPRAEVEARARALLDKVDIHDKADVYPAQLSGGQQQRAAIARALCMEPRALLFDEPTSALDPELEQEVIRVIKALAEEGRTMLLVTHDMRLAADVADHVMFLHEGRVEEEGPPKTLFGQPSTERLRGFLNTAAA